LAPSFQDRRQNDRFTQPKTTKLFKPQEFCKRLSSSAELVIEGLAAKSPDDVSLLRDLVATELNVADGLIKLGNRVAAAPYASKAVALVRKLAAAHPDDPELVNAVKLGEDVARRAAALPASSPSATRQANSNPATPASTPTSR
jgi:hypothetical protein